MLGHVGLGLGEGVDVALPRLTSRFPAKKGFCEGPFSSRRRERPVRPMDRSRISVILGVTSAQELLGSMVEPPAAAGVGQGAARAGLPEDEAQAVCERIAANYVPWQESTLPRPARQRRRRPHRQPPRPRRHQLRHRRRLRQLASRRCRWRSTSCALGAVGPRDHRRRRHVQRHLHVHVLQQDAGAVADRRLPPVLRQRRRHACSARASAWSRSSASPTPSATATASTR